MKVSCIFHCKRVQKHSSREPQWRQNSQFFFMHTIKYKVGRKCPKKYFVVCPLTGSYATDETSWNLSDNVLKYLHDIIKMFMFFFAKKWCIWFEMDRSAVLFVIALHARTCYERCLQMVILSSWKLIKLSSFLGQSLCAWPWSWTLNCFRKPIRPSTMINTQIKEGNTCLFILYIFSEWFCAVMI